MAGELLEPPATDMPFTNVGVCYFRTDRNGPDVFVCGPYMQVVRIGPFEGAIAQACGLWPVGGIDTVSVTDDVADWLASRP